MSILWKSILLAVTLHVYVWNGYPSEPIPDPGAILQSNPKFCRVVDIILRYTPPPTTSLLAPLSNIFEKITSVHAIELSNPDRTKLITLAESTFGGRNLMVIQGKDQKSTPTVAIVVTGIGPRYPTILKMRLSTFITDCQIIDIVDLISTSPQESNNIRDSIQLCALFNILKNCSNAQLKTLRQKFKWCYERCVEILQGVDLAYYNEEDSKFFKQVKDFLQINSIQDPDDTALLQVASRIKSQGLPIVNDRAIKLIKLFFERLIIVFNDLIKISPKSNIFHNAIIGAQSLMNQQSIPDLCEQICSKVSMNAGLSTIKENSEQLYCLEHSLHSEPLAVYWCKKNKFTEATFFTHLGKCETCNPFMLVALKNLFPMKQTLIFSFLPATRIFSLPKFFVPPDKSTSLIRRQDIEIDSIFDLGNLQNKQISKSQHTVYRIRLTHSDWKSEVIGTYAYGFPLFSWMKMQQKNILEEIKTNHILKYAIIEEDSLRPDETFYSGEQAIHEYDFLLNRTPLIQETFQKICVKFGHFKYLPLTQSYFASLLQHYLMQNLTTISDYIYTTLNNNIAVLHQTMNFIHVLSKATTIKSVLEMMLNNKDKTTVRNYIMNNLQQLFNDVLDLLFYYITNNSGAIWHDNLEKTTRMIMYLLEKNILEPKIVINTLIDNIAMGGGCAQGFLNRMFDITRVLLQY
jgi:hypothetical protein